MSEISALMQRLQENTNRQLNDSEQIVTDALRQLEETTNAQLQRAESGWRNAIAQQNQRVLQQLKSHEAQMTGALDSYQKTTEGQIERLVTFSGTLWLASIISFLLGGLVVFLILKSGLFQL